MRSPASRTAIYVPLADARDLGPEELGRFFARELLGRGGYIKAVTEARVIGAVAERGLPVPEEAERN